MNKKVLVIGAGIHGVTVAIELAKKGNEVTVIDAKKDMLLGASYATHGRIHLGYHYPRSRETAIECIHGYNHFIKNYKDCLVFPDFYYVIEKNKSNVTAGQYKQAMEEAGLDCISNWPDKKFLNREHIEDSFKVKEACFDIWKLINIFTRKFNELNIKTIFDFEIKNVSRIKDRALKITSSDSQEIKMEVDLIVNCTYTYTNNVQKAFGVTEDLTPYKFESTEIAVVESDMKIPALTVMDGPFITILPYIGKENHYIVYDKVHSVISQETDTEYTPPKDLGTNWDKMLEHGIKYYPFFNNLKYKYSLYGSRPISLKTKNDGRSTKVIKHDYPIDFYSILEGKFVSAPLIAEIFVKMVDSGMNINEKSALIGDTGFIGSNLKNDYLFSEFYNSKNIQHIENKEYDWVLSCANSSARWKVNLDPEEDLRNILEYIEHIKKARIKKFILISTIDVYENPIKVYEDSDTGIPEQNPYGKNRLILEKFVKDNFKNFLIVRLPIVYGPNFKKNIIYDALNNHELDKVNTEAQVQVYNVKNLMKDIQIAMNQNIKVINIATFPLKVKEIYKEAFNLDLDNPSCKEFKYDMKTRYPQLFGKKIDYAYDKSEVLADLKNFKKEYESLRI